MAPAPDANTIVLWRSLAERYRDEPAVLFDLFNEPHDRLGDDFLPIHVIGPIGEVVESGSPFDLRGIQVDAPGVVYSAHIYPDRRPKTWWRALGRSREAPVFVGEWGGTADDLAFGRALAERIRREGLGWTAWSWFDCPHLIQPSRASSYEATIFGEFVRSQLAAI